MIGNIHQNPEQQAEHKGDIFLEFRRKVQGLEVLSASIVHLLKSLGFTGRLTVVIQNGQVLKSGYEEGYFRRKEDLNF